MSFQKSGGKNKQAGGGNRVKLYSDFYHSDIILASPLGLNLCCFAADDDGSGSDDDGTARKKPNDIDFLSSVEILLIHHADLILMQNWDHVNPITSRGLNRQPTSNHSTIDFSRVREYLLAARAVGSLSQLQDPYIGSTFQKTANGHNGRIRLRRRITHSDHTFHGPSIANVARGSLRQVFQRIPSTSIASSSADRLRYFRTTVLPALLRPEDGPTPGAFAQSLHDRQQKHTLVYLPSYFDFVSLRNHLTEIGASFVSVTEYARVSEISRGRARPR